MTQPETTEEIMAAKSAAKSSKGKKKNADRPHATTSRVMSAGTQARTAAMNACAPMVTQGELVAELKKEGAELSRTSVGFILNGAWYNADVVRVFCRLTGTRPSHVWPEFIDERGNVREGVKSKA